MDSKTKANAEGVAGETSEAPVATKENAGVNRVTLGLDRVRYLLEGTAREPVSEKEARDLATEHFDKYEPLREDEADFECRFDQMFGFYRYSMRLSRKR